MSLRTSFVTCTPDGRGTWVGLVIGPPEVPSPRSPLVQWPHTQTVPSLFTAASAW